MKWLAILWAVGLLAACSVPDASGGGKAGAGASKANTLANGSVCRIGPDGGPVVADRGIGGTGAPRVVDRGIGGTGIVGVITGFASICVNGLEVRYDSSATVDIGGIPASPALLRVGQVVAIQAYGSQSAPVASVISVRQEVAGRIEAVELGTGLLTIAGQPVAIGANTRGAASIRPGDWVVVSGLRTANGTLDASRVDAARPGTFKVHGQVVLDGGSARVGGLALTGTAASTLTNGQFVAVSGRYVSGQALAVTVVADRLTSDPGRYFGPGVKHLVLESFVRVSNGSVWLNGRKVKAAPGVGGMAESAGVAVVSLDRKADGEFTAVRMHYTQGGGFGIGSPATSPNAGGSAPPLTSLQIRHGSSPEATAMQAADIEPVWTGAPVSELAIQSGGPGGGVPPSSAGAVGVAAVDADAQRIESEPPDFFPSTSDLIDRIAPNGNATVVSAAGSGSSGGIRHAFLVGGPSFSSAGGLFGSLQEADGPTVASSPHGIMPMLQAEAAGTGSERSSSSGVSRQTGH